MNIESVFKMKGFLNFPHNTIMEARKVVSPSHFINIEGKGADDKSLRFYSCYCCYYYYYCCFKSNSFSFTHRLSCCPSSGGFLLCLDKGYTLKTVNKKQRLLDFGFLIHPQTQQCALSIVHSGWKAYL